MQRQTVLEGKYVAGKGKREEPNFTVQLGHNMLQSFCDVQCTQCTGSCLEVVGCSG